MLKDCYKPKHLWDTLAALPTTLYDMYSRILSNIRERVQEDVIRVLQFLAYSERPLTIEEARDAIAVELTPHPHLSMDSMMPNPHDIASICSSLVSLSTTEAGLEGATVLRLSHLSVKEYLMSGQVIKPFQESLTEINARGTVTRVCLAYLSHLDVKSSVAKIRNNFPLARYSAQYWMQHARHTEIEKDVQKSILNFFLQQEEAYTVWGNLFDPDHPRSTPDAFRDMATPLYYASAAGLRHTVRLLIENHAKVNAQGGLYGSALQAASFKGHKEIIQLLLENGANVNAQSGHYGSALQTASLRGHKEIIQLLLDTGANVNAQSGHYGSALQAASLRGCKEIIQLLLENGADANMQGALQIVCMRGYKKIVKLLLDNRTDANVQGALQAACMRGHKEIVQLLLDHGANANTQDRYHGSALQAASFNGHKEIVQLLLDNGAEPCNTPQKCLPSEFTIIPPVTKSFLPLM